MTTSAHDSARPLAEYEQVDLHGLSPAELQSAIDLFRTVTEQRLTERDALHQRLSTAFLDGGVNLVSPATQRQALKNAELRSRLLDEEGAETYESLAALRDSSESSTRTWVARQRSKEVLFTVEVHGRTLIPSLQLTEAGGLDPQISPLVEQLVSAGLGPWGVWSWLTAPEGRLSGDIPADVAWTEPARALRAAERYARELRTAQAHS
jgi:murein L,D-transpeptidase YcbB/YkuD